MESRKFTTTRNSITSIQIIIEVYFTYLVYPFGTQPGPFRGWDSMKNWHILFYLLCSQCLHFWHLSGTPSEFGVLRKIGFFFRSLCLALSRGPLRSGRPRKCNCVDIFISNVSPMCTMFTVSPNMTFALWNLFVLGPPVWSSWKKNRPLAAPLLRCWDPKPEPVGHRRKSPSLNEGW